MEKELNRGVNHDEAVAYGVAVQAALIGGHERSQNVPAIFECNDLTIGDRDCVDHWNIAKQFIIIIIFQSITRTKT